MVGSFSDICMFSFDPVKTITCIDGGALVVRTEDDQKRLQEMRLIGMGQSPAVMYQNKRAWAYDVRRLGFRYHLANLHAAIGLTQLEALPGISSSRRESLESVLQEAILGELPRLQRGLALLAVLGAVAPLLGLLGAVPGIRVPGSDFTDITPFSYYIRVSEEQRQELRTFLAHRGVDTGVHWQPGHLFTLFEKCRRGDLSVTDRVGTEIMTLPLHSMMDDGDRQRVVTGVTEFFEKQA